MATERPAPKKSYQRHQSKTGKKFYHTALTFYRGYYTRTVPKLGVTRYWYSGAATWVSVHVGDRVVDMHRMTFARVSLDFQAKEVALSRCVRGFRADFRKAKIDTILEKIDNGTHPEGWRTAG